MTVTQPQREPAHLAAVPAAERRVGAAVSMHEVSKAYGPVGNAVLALDRISLTVRQGEFVCLVGASGCGKSTLLNLIAGLDQPASGEVAVPGGRTTLLFQEAALFPWLTAAANIDLAMRLRKRPKDERAARIAALLHMVHLDGFGDKRPHELSGGMRQRVALARALAQDVDIMLMDEPFGALDAITRDLLHDELEALWQETGLTVLFVTHNVSEAVRLGDRVVLMTSRPGKVAEEFPVAIDRPRRMDDPAVGALAGQITERLREEVRRHAND